MISGISHKTKQFFLLLIKLSIVIGAGYFIYNKIANNQELRFLDFYHILIENDVFSTKNLVFLLFLTIFNWFFEILKWQNLVRFIKYISFYKALSQSLASLTASILTPNRIGEYGVKIVYYKRENRKKILLLNLIGNFAQMGATIVFGIIGFILFVNKYNVDISYYKIVRAITLLFIIGFFVIIRVNQNKIVVRGYSIKQIFNFIKSIPRSIHFKNILYAIIRYLLFSFQFYVLLTLFKVEISYYDAMIFITSFYLLSSIIPTIFVLDVIVKGSIALFLFQYFHINEMIILSIVALMWILNFAFPSIVGSFFVMNYKYPKSLPKEY